MAPQPPTCLYALTALALLACCYAPAPSSAAAIHGISLGRKHLARANALEPVLDARDGNARFTRYVAGLGACGKVNSDSDFIVAINVEQWDGGAHCFEPITITYGGKTETAVIVDECMGCPFNGLDLSDGLFGSLADLGAGVITGSWSFGSGGGGGDATPKPKPVTTVHHTTSTTTWIPPPQTTTTHAAAPTTTLKPSPTSTSTAYTTKISTPSPKSTLMNSATSSSSTSASSSVASPSASAASVWGGSGVLLQVTNSWMTMAQLAAYAVKEVLDHESSS